MTKRQVFWRSVWLGILVYEGAAMVSGGKLPWITDAVRAMPRPVRLAVPVTVAAILHDHFETQRWF